MKATLSSVRVRVTLAATCLVGIALLGGAAVFVHSVERRLLGEIRDDAADVAKNAADRLDGSAQPGTRVGDALVQAFTVDGKPVDAFGIATRTQDTGTLIAPPVAAEPYETYLRGQRYTVSSTEVQAPTGTYVVLAALPLEDVERSVRAVRSLLVVGAPALLVLVGVLAWALTGRALRPIERMRSDAEAISATTLGRRLPTPPSKDEVARLATTLNGMLERLEMASLKQKQFVSDASHELRSPLATLRADLEIALAHPNDAQWERTAENVLADCSRVEAIVADLLRLAELQEVGPSGDEDLLDVASVVRSIAGRPRSVEVVTARLGTGYVRGHQRDLETIVGNLVDNAARFAKVKVEVTVVASPRTVTLTVEDDGPGIPEEARSLVFERFSRLDEARDRDSGGVGLGLAIVAAGTERLGGAVSVDESDFGGAKFTVQLPAAATAHCGGVATV